MKNKNIIKEKGVFHGIIYILDEGKKKKWEHNEISEIIVVEIIEPMEFQAYDRGFVDGISCSFLNKIKKFLKIGWYR